MKHPTERYKCTINKLYIYNLLDYDRVCYIDADALIISNPDELFNYQHFFFYRYDDSGVNAGMAVCGTFFIITPDQEKYFTLLKKALEYHEDEILFTHQYPYFLNAPLEESLELYCIHDRSYPKYFMFSNWKQNANDFYQYYTGEFLFDE